MLKTLSWIDFSEKDRRRMLDVVNLFKEQDTRDELGIGAVRDALSETLFPGTTTIMTRARYFLFVPWIYQERERILYNAGRHTAKGSVASLCREYEMYLISALKKGGESTGVIGIEAGRGLRRLPSSVYWAGLGRWGIRRFPGAQSEYHRQLQRYDYRNIARVLDEDNQPLAAVSGANWHPALPQAPADWLTKTTLALDHAEAVFLKERILGTCSGTMLAHLVDYGSASADGAGADFPWAHPALGDFPLHIQRELEHARLFSRQMHGAALLYNLLLAEASRNEDWRLRYRMALHDWAVASREDAEALGAWVLDDFWNTVLAVNPRIAGATRRFIDDWINLARGASNPASIADDRAARDLIRYREHSLKGGRSRLANPRRLELWGGASGTGMLDYRWGTVRPIVDDILRGL